MNLRYQTYFYITDDDVIDDVKLKILEEFSKTNTKIQRYENIKEAELKLVKERSGMLAELKDEFTSFIKEAHPEYLL